MTAAPPDLSPTQAAVLAHLRAHPGDYAADVARALWPDSPSWQRRSRGRNERNGALGVTTAWLAYTIISRLRDLKLVQRSGRDGDYGFYLTAAGEKAIR